MILLLYTIVLISLHIIPIKKRKMFDFEKLIMEVESRHCFWDMSSPINHDKQYN